MKTTLKCPVCQLPMKDRLQNGEHINKSLNKVYRHKYYQYYCEVCDDDKTGWTTTESDERSLKLK